MSAGRMRGHAAVYSSPALIGKGDYSFWEAIAPGAFDRALRERQDVTLLFNHERDHVLARTTSGTLRLSSDKTGLVVDADIADTSIGRDVAHLLARRDIGKMSFSFTPRKERWGLTKDGTDMVVVTDVDLWDVSVVTRPAYDTTDASLVPEKGSRAWAEQQLAHIAEQKRHEGRRALEADMARWRHAQASFRLRTIEAGLSKARAKPARR